MTLKSDVKFEEKLTLGFGTHEEFGEFWLTTRKSQNLHFNGLLLSKVYNVWAKKLQRSYVSWHWTVRQYLKEKLTGGLKNDKEFD